MDVRILGIVAFGLGNACAAPECESTNGQLLIEDIYLSSCPQNTELSTLVVYGDSINDFGNAMSRFPNLRRLSFDFTSNLSVFPEGVENLGQLTELTIQGTSLVEIPSDVGELPLQSLRIAHNAYLTKISDLNGPLTELRIVGNPTLEVLPSALGNISTLNTLDVSNNALNKVPLSLTSYGHLENLYLQGNQLTRLPSDIDQLQLLKVIDLSDNDFQSLPVSFGYIPILTNIRMHHLPRLEALPSFVGLRSLIYLSILDCPSLTEFPDGVSGLQDLMFVDLYTTSIKSIPPEFFELPQLEIVQIRMNPNLTDLPAEIGQAKELRFLLVDQNNLQSLPPEIGELSKLETLYADENELLAIPDELCGLSNLEELSVSINKISKLCPDLGRLSSLRHLNIHSNPISHLPESISQLGDLELINLWNVPLESYPESLLDLPRLRQVGLSDENELPNPEVYQRLRQQLGGHISIFEP